MPEDKKKQIQTLLNALDPDRLSKEDFVNSFEKVVDLILANEKKQAQAIDSLEKAFGNATNKLQETGDLTLVDVRKEVKGELGKALKTQSDSLNFMRDKARGLKDGKTPSKDELLAIIEPLIPDPEKGEQGEQGKAENIEQLKKDLEEFKKDTLERLEKALSNIPRGGKIITGRYVNTPIIDRLTGSTDGATKTFTLSKAPREVSTMEVSGTDFPIILDPTVDFSVTGKVLTLTAAVPAPSQGATLICKYYV